MQNGDMSGRVKTTKALLRKRQVQEVLSRTVLVFDKRDGRMANKGGIYRRGVAFIGVALPREKGLLVAFSSSVIVREIEEI